MCEYMIWVMFVDIYSLFVYLPEAGNSRIVTNSNRALGRVYTRLTCCLNEQHVDGNVLPGNNLLVQATCCLYLSNIITIHLCHSRLVSLCIQQHTGNKLATILLPIYKQHVDSNRTHVDGQHVALV